MTQDEIIELAVKAGMRREVVTMYENPELLEAFAKLVAEHERKECAEQYLRIMRNAVKDAVEREREACAEVADEYTKASYLGAVGAAIRSRGRHE